MNIKGKLENFKLSRETKAISRRKVTSSMACNIFSDFIIKLSLKKEIELSNGEVLMCISYLRNSGLKTATIYEEPTKDLLNLLIVNKITQNNIINLLINALTNNLYEVYLLDHIKSILLNKESELSQENIIKATILYDEILESDLSLQNKRLALLYFKSTYLNLTTTKNQVKDLNMYLKKNMPKKN